MPNRTTDDFMSRGVVTERVAGGCQLCKLLAESFQLHFDISELLRRGRFLGKLCLFVFLPLCLPSDKCRKIFYILHQRLEYGFSIGRFHELLFKRRKFLSLLFDSLTTDTTILRKCFAQCLRAGFCLSSNFSCTLRHASINTEFENAGQ